MLNDLGSEWVHSALIHISHPPFTRWRIFFYQCIWKNTAGNVSSNDSVCVPGRGHALGRSPSVGLLSETLKYPLGFADLQPGAVFVTLGGSVLEQPPHVLSSNIFQTLPWPHRPHSHQRNICTYLLKHDPRVKRAHQQWDFELRSIKMMLKCFQG